MRPWPVVMLATTTFLPVFLSGADIVGGRIRGSVSPQICSLLLCPLSIFSSVLHTPDVSPAKEDKESEFWKMLQEPEEQAAGREEAQAGVRSGLSAVPDEPGPRPWDGEGPSSQGLRGDLCLSRDERSMEGRDKPSHLSLTFLLIRNRT